MLMNDVLVYFSLVLFGLSLGSYAAATVWRLRARQLQEDKANKEPYDKKEYGRLKKLLNKKTVEDRSQCLECGYQLRWYDLIPLVSWISLRGKCRECRHPIGWFEPAMEIGVAAFFVASFLFWPIEFTSWLTIAHFILWLAAGVVMAVLFAYDTRWFLLPNKFSILLAIIGAAVTTVVVVGSDDPVATLIGAGWAVVAIAGLYGLLYRVSGGRWVGFGDVKLGVGLGLLLVDWRLSLLAVFLANLIGCFIAIPLLATKRIKRNAHIPFGPMLIAGTVIAWLFGHVILDWYLGGLGLY